MWETWVQSLGWEDPLEEGIATHSSILVWRIPWTAYYMGSQSVGHDFVSEQLSLLPVWLPVLSSIYIPWSELGTRTCIISYNSHDNLTGQSTIPNLQRKKQKLGKLFQVTQQWVAEVKSEPISDSDIHNFPSTIQFPKSFSSIHTHTHSHIECIWCTVKWVQGS